MASLQRKLQENEVATRTETKLLLKNGKLLYRIIFV